MLVTLPIAIHRIEEHVFVKDRIPDPLVFLIPQDPVYLFVTESIPRIVEEPGLVGFDSAG